MYHPLTQMNNLLITINSSVNFIIYCIFGEKFKRIFFHLFCRLTGRDSFRCQPELLRYPSHSPHQVRISFFLIRRFLLLNQNDISLQFLWLNQTCFFYLLWMCKTQNDFCVSSENNSHARFIFTHPFILFHSFAWLRFPKCHLGKWQQRKIFGGSSVLKMDVSCQSLSRQQKDFCQV